MFNTDTTVPEWEKSPENHTENQENAELSQRAQAWAEAFPNDSAAENPWLTTNMESNALAEPETLATTETPEMPIAAGEDVDKIDGINPNPSQEEDIPNQLTDTTNVVTGQTQEVWNTGDGGQKSLESAYDAMRGTFSAQDIGNSAQLVNAEIADTLRENSSKSLNSEAELALDNNLNPEEEKVSTQEQSQADLYNLVTSAGVTALNAKAQSETAIESLQQDNQSLEAAAAERSLADAKQTLENIQGDMNTIAQQIDQDPLAIKTASDTIDDAQKMVLDAQESLQTAQDQASERQDYIDENQEAVEDLQNQGVQMEEINQSIDETGGIEKLQTENSPENEDEIPRVSIFG